MEFYSLFHNVLYIKICFPLRTSHKIGAPKKTGYIYPI